MQTQIGDSYRNARTYRRAAYGSILLGTAALLIGSWIGLGLVGLVVYVLGVLGGFGLMAYVRRAESFSLADEREAALERRASHYTVSLFGAFGWVALVGASLLDATGYRVMSSVEETLLFAFAAFFLVWGVIYGLLRRRR